VVVMSVTIVALESWIVSFSSYHAHMQQLICIVYFRVWNSARQCIFLLEGHRDAVTSLATVPPPGEFSIGMY
jgi:hypothetical protein